MVSKTFIEVSDALWACEQIPAAARPTAVLPECWVICRQCGRYSGKSMNFGVLGMRLESSLPHLLVGYWARKCLQIFSMFVNGNNEIGQPVGCERN